MAILSGLLSTRIYSQDRIDGMRSETILLATERNGVAHSPFDGFHSTILSECVYWRARSLNTAESMLIPK